MNSKRNLRSEHNIWSVSTLNLLNRAYKSILLLESEKTLSDSNGLKAPDVL